MKKPYENIADLELIRKDEPYRFHYLELHRMHLRNHYPDGQVSRVYTYEAVVRRNLDAVAVLLFDENAKDHNPKIYLRRNLRPPLALRSLSAQSADVFPQILQLAEKPILLEVVAGLLEDQESDEPGLRKRALAEIWEETGFQVRPDQLISLGAAPYPTPGMNPEAIHLFAAPIDPQKAQCPPGDGSPTEEVGGLVAFLLSQAIAACWEGLIRDAKTEICLHRLRQHLRG